MSDDPSRNDPSDDLTIYEAPCFVSGTDRLKVHRVPGTTSCLAFAANCEMPDVETFIVLDEDRVRRLYEALGGWLGEPTARAAAQDRANAESLQRAMLCSSAWHRTVTVTLSCPTCGTSAKLRTH